MSISVLVWKENPHWSIQIYKNLLYGFSSLTHKQWPAQFWSCEKFSHVNLNDQLLVGYIHSKKGYGEPKSRRKCFLILYQLCHESQSHDVFQLKRYFFKSIKSQFVINQGQISSSFVSCSTNVSNTNLDANLAQKRY